MNIGEVRVSVLLEWLQSVPWAVFIQKTPWAFTTIKVVHVFTVSMVLCTIVLADLRLLGLASTKRPFAEFSRQVLPFTWAAFMVAVIAGSLLFIGNASEYFTNWVFWLKISLIVLAGINMMIFEFRLVRGVAGWNLVRHRDRRGSQEGARLPVGFSSSFSVA